MLVTIKTVEKADGDYGEYIKVTGFDGNGKETFKNVSSKFEDRWPLLKPNATVEFKMKKKDNKWVINDIIPAEFPSSEGEARPMVDRNEEPPLVKEIKKVGAKVEDVKYKADPDKTASIENQVCLKTAGEITVAMINAGLLKDKVTEKTIIVANAFKEIFK